MSHLLTRNNSILLGDVLLTSRPHLLEVCHADSKWNGGDGLNGCLRCFSLAPKEVRAGLQFTTQTFEVYWIRMVVELFNTVKVKSSLKSAHLSFHLCHWMFWGPKAPAIYIYIYITIGFIILKSVYFLGGFRLNAWNKVYGEHKLDIFSHFILRHQYISNTLLVIFGDIKHHHGEHGNPSIFWSAFSAWS